MKLYTLEHIIDAYKDGYFARMVGKQSEHKSYELPEAIELPSDEEIIGRFMNWFLKHYSTATIDGMFGYVNSMEQEVTIREILDDYFNKEKILNQNK